MGKNGLDKVKVLVLVHDGFEETEFIAPVDLLRRAGAEVTVVSMTGNRRMKGSHGITILSDALWPETRLKPTACSFPGEAGILTACATTNA